MEFLFVIASFSILLYLIVIRYSGLNNGRIHTPFFKGLLLQHQHNNWNNQNVEVKNFFIDRIDVPP